MTATVLTAHVLWHLLPFLHFWANSSGVWNSRIHRRFPRQWPFCRKGTCLGVGRTQSQGGNAVSTWDQDYCQEWTWTDKTCRIARQITCSANIKCHLSRIFLNCTQNSILMDVTWTHLIAISNMNRSFRIACSSWEAYLRIFWRCEVKSLAQKVWAQFYTF